jgi:hypothetical protein
MTWEQLVGTDIGKFLNSNLFIALVTFLVGSFAIWLYIRKRRDLKRDAAKTILLEAQNAERAMRNIQNQIVSNGVVTITAVMPTESWSRYKYMFAQDFDSNEWEAIANFYAKARQCDEAQEYNESFFQKNEEQIRSIMQQLLSKYAQDYVDKATANGADKTKLWDEFTAKRNEISAKNVDFSIPYSPQKPLTDIQFCIQTTDLGLSQGSVGQKLKKIARIKP